MKIKPLQGAVKQMAKTPYECKQYHSIPNHTVLLEKLARKMRASQMASRCMKP
jgi:hypothetical protein